MTVFRYRAVAADGRIVHGKLDATSREAALDRLQKDGHYPIETRPASRALEWRVRLDDLHRSRTRVRRADVASFTRELATVVNAGVPLDAALRTISAHCSQPRLKPILSALQGDVQGGQALSAALARHPRIFHPLHIALVQAGETGGSLHATLRQLAEYLERVQALRASLVSSLTYPAILLAAATLSLFVLTGFVVPQFVPLFADAGAALPLLTRLVFGASLFMQRFGWAVLLIAAFALYGCQRWLKYPDNRARLDRWLLQLPVVGELIKKLEAARLARTLGTLTRSGVPLLTGLNHARAAVGNEMIRLELDSCIERVKAGGRLAEALTVKQCLPGLAIELFAIGEETGQLDEMLLKVAAIYDEQTEAALKRLIALAEPALILGLGGLIALIIVSILMAMLGLNDLVV